MDWLSHDLRTARRQFARRPYLFSIALFTLALGIAGNATVLLIARGVLVRPLPYEHSDELVMVWLRPRNRPSIAQGFRDDAALSRQISTPSLVLQWRREATLLRDLAAVELWQNNPTAEIDVIGTEGAERLRGGAATPNFFSVLGVTPQLGRTFDEDDTSAVVISDGLWRRMFGADSSVVGRTIDASVGRDRERQRLTIIGVLEPRFRFTYPKETEIWTVLPWSDLQQSSPNAVRFQVVARLRSTSAKLAAEGELAQVYEAQERAMKVRDNQRMTAYLESVHDYVVSGGRDAVALLLFLSGLVLLICCISVGVLLLANSAGKQRDIAVKLALGATRIRVISEILTESALLGIGGALIALVTVTTLEPVIRAMLPTSLPRSDEVSVDAVALAWLSLVVILSIALVALIPALVSAFGEVPVTAMNEHAVSGTRSRKRARQHLIAVEIAFVSILLIVGGRLLQGFWNLSRTDLGFDAASVVTAEMRLTDPQYRDNSRRVLFQRQVLERIRALPGVSAAGTTSAIPFRGTDFLRIIPRPDHSGTLMVNERRGDNGYLDAMRIPLLAGRRFAEGDVAVALLSESLARELFPDGSAVGRTIKLREMNTVIGIVGDIRARRIDSKPNPAFYLPAEQSPAAVICVVVRTTQDPMVVRTAIPAIVRSIDRNQPVEGITTVSELVSASIADRRFYAATTAVFGILTLVLATAGITGVLTILIAERRREFGIRSVLGAGPREVRILVWKSGMLPVVGGLVIGTLAATGLMVFLRQFLFQVSDHDPVPYVLTVAIVCGTSFAACSIPAHRAARVDAASALRQV